MGKRIYNVINELDMYFNKKEIVPYFEPFIGMAGVMKHFGNQDRDLLACDINNDIILMWKAIQKGWKPPLKCSKIKYNKLKNSNVPSAERGYVGSVASWGGIFFHAFRLDYSKSRDFMKEGYNSMMNIKKDIMNVHFLPSTSYENFNPENMVIYCDPPYYKNNLGNSESLFQTFDHQKFWNTIRKWSKTNLVIVSESSAPDDFKRVWSSASTIVISRGRSNPLSKKYNENLYVYKPIYDKLNKQILNKIKTL